VRKESRTGGSGKFRGSGGGAKEREGADVRALHRRSRGKREDGDGEKRKKRVAKDSWTYNRGYLAEGGKGKKKQLLVGRELGRSQDRAFVVSTFWVRKEYRGDMDF